MNKCTKIKCWIFTHFLKERLCCCSERLIQFLSFYMRVNLILRVLFSVFCVFFFKMKQLLEMYEFSALYAQLDIRARSAWALIWAFDWSTRDRLDNLQSPNLTRSSLTSFGKRTECDPSSFFMPRVLQKETSEGGGKKLPQRAAAVCGWFMQRFRRSKTEWATGQAAKKQKKK